MLINESNVLAMIGELENFVRGLKDAELKKLDLVNKIKGMAASMETDDNLTPLPVPGGEAPVPTDNVAPESEFDQAYTDYETELAQPDEVSADMDSALSVDENPDIPMATGESKKTPGKPIKEDGAATGGEMTSAAAMASGVYGLWSYPKDGQKKVKEFSTPVMVREFMDTHKDKWHENL